MASIDTARLLAQIGGILSTVFGTIYIIWGIILALISPILGAGPVIYGILSIIFGGLTLTIARDSLVEGEELRTGAIICFVFGGVSAVAIGGIVTIVAGVLAIIAWHEGRKAVRVTPAPLPPPKPEAKVAYCPSCGAQVPPEAGFCPSCGKKIKK